MKKKKPTNSGIRGTVSIEYRKVLSQGNKPEKSLTKGRKRHVGRNGFGRITQRHKGGGHKRLYREIDFRNSQLDIPGKIVSVEYDPNRTGFISLVHYANGAKAYILSPKSLKVGDTVMASEKAKIAPGNRTPMKNIPVGTFIYNVELKPHGGAKLARSAGNYAEIIAHDNGFVHIKMPSSEIRKIRDTAWASVGEVSNSENQLVKLGKAGRSRHRGIRPTVRGSAMNPVDHPYGGGEGRQGRGLRRAKNVYGNLVGIGQKTRKPKKYSNVFIVSRRKVGKRRK